MRVSTRMGLLAAATLFLCALFIGLDLKGNLSYALNYRAMILATMFLVGIATSIATVLFQTLTQNRILTPSIMGFEALYVFIQTSVIFFLGSTGWEDWSPLARFFTETAMMIMFASALYRWIFTVRQGDLYRLLLVGLVFGILFRSLSEFMQRLLAPNEFDALQGRLFAQLTVPDSRLIAASAVIIGLTSLTIWRRRRELDVIALGRDSAVGLGVDYDRAVTWSLTMIATLVAAATALIGPLTFLGLAAATLTYPLAGSYRHSVVLPFAALMGVSFLAGGQLILDHIFDMGGTLSVVIEFVGGGMFLLLLLLRKERL